MLQENKLVSLYEGLCGCSVFRGVMDAPLFRAFFHLMETEGNRGQKLKQYGAFVAEIYVGGGNLTACVRKAVFEDENVYIVSHAKGKTCDPHILETLSRELALFSEFAALTSCDFESMIGMSSLAGFTSETVDLGVEYTARVKEIHKYGYGIFASCGMFRLSDSEERKIEPILSSDPVTLDSFVGYYDERVKVLANTQSFVEGKPAANVLLYGDAGTGKSSTVKAVANYFFSQGVRLIEVRKDQMGMLPFVMEKISGNPLKFIIFIDDLSFNQNDDTFSMLKAALEGSASAKASNAVIYATSNRRHIVRECFGDREGSDVHRNDTMQELLSLSARFGLSIRFEKPNKTLYLEIVRELAQKKHVTMDPEQLEIKAEAFALSRGHRSARCAEQFIDSLL